MAEALRWRLHAMMPRGTHKANLGDQPMSSEARYGTYDRFGPMAVLPSADADGLLRSQVQHWLGRIGGVPTSAGAETAQTVEELLRYDPGAATATDLSALPLSYHATGAGVFIHRTSWTDQNATAMVFESGELTESHRYLAANSLQIWKGSFWISSNANVFSQSGINQGSSLHNTLTIGGQGQRRYTSSNSGRIVTTQTSGPVVVVRGQGKDTYGLPSSRVLSDFLRTVAYVQALDAFVVVDKVTALDASQAKVIRWHTRDLPQTDGTWFRLMNPAGDHRCFGNVVHPAGAALSVEEVRLGSSTTAASSHAVAITVSAGRATDVIVTVLQCTSGLTQSVTPTASLTATEVTVTLGSTRVIVPLSETGTVRLQ
jgi:hypothetical protein